MDKPVDFTQEIIAEAKAFRKDLLVYNFVQDALSYFIPTTLISLMIDWMNKTEELNSIQAKHEEEIKMLSLMAVIVETNPQQKGKGFDLILEERNRQIERGYTIARDKMNYPGNELKRFALHRLTGLDIYYPFKDNGFKNTNGNHSKAERHIQAGAILLAHIQKNIAVNQLSEWLLHATNDERNLELAKEISDQ